MNFASPHKILCRPSLYRYTKAQADWRGDCGADRSGDPLSNLEGDCGADRSGDPLSNLGLHAAQPPCHHRSLMSWYVLSLKTSPFQSPSALEAQSHLDYACYANAWTEWQVSAQLCNADRRGGGVLGIKPGVFNQCSLCQNSAKTCQNQTSWWNQTIINQLKKMIQWHTTSFLFKILHVQSLFR